MSNAHLAIIFNGPPGSGKDHAADFITGLIEESQHLRFKDHLFKLTLLIYNVSEDDFFELYNNRETKNEPTCLLYGDSPRSAMIKVSEEVIKPVYGKGYFGNIAAEKLCYGLNVFSDGGFLEEIEPVYKQCDGQMMIIELHRPDCSYESDSRSYIGQYRDADHVVLHNDSTIESFELKLADIVHDFLLKRS